MDFVNKGMPLGFLKEWYVVKDMSEDDFILKYATQYQGLSTYAVLINGEWSSNCDYDVLGNFIQETSSWEVEFKRLFNSIDSESIITIVDCHVI